MSWLQVREFQLTQTVWRSFCYCAELRVDELRGVSGAIAKTVVKSSGDIVLGDIDLFTRS